MERKRRKVFTAAEVAENAEQFMFGEDGFLFNVV